MKSFKKTIYVALFIFSVFAFFAEQAAAIVPTERIRETTDIIRDIVTDSKLKSGAKTTERRQKIRDALDKRFDFAEMAKRSLGHHWRRYPDRQKEFTKLFVELLERTYIAEIESFEDEIIDYKKEVVEQEFAEVATSVTLPKTGRDFSVVYKLHLKDGDWKVYDVVFEGISAVNNYRSQFNRVITQKGGFEELMKRLREKGEMK
ncbi:MAG: ABC transporter substrate-binding protein [Candidatus Sungbacteria bacterium]|nr:ABC transporter substrate-binding protein [Candidatus Sungbacteria bacterium]